MSAAAQLLMMGGAFFLLSDFVDQQYLLSKDLTNARRLRAFRRRADHAIKCNYTYADFWHDMLNRHRDRVLFGYEGISLTFQDVDKMANRLANWMLLNGIGRKDVVALFLDNRPHFAALLIALAKIGCRAVLVNVNMRDMVLTHCINQSEATAMVFGSEKTEQVMAIQDALVAKGILKLFSLGPSLPLLPYAGISASSAPYVSNDSPLVIISDVNSIRRASPEHVPAELRAGLSVHDHFCYIYTSGTTGLPSMARLSHLRAYHASFYFQEIFGIQSSDVIYAPLPLHHFAGLISIGVAISAGARLVITPRFSVRRFWEDVRSNNVTVIQYIGEQCRYLLRAPLSPFDAHHNVRLAFGNGLRKDIFKDFQERFKIPEIGEFYMHTESASTLQVRVDINGKGAGAVGHVGPFTKLMRHHVLVRYDPVTEQPMRDARGMCIPCKPGQIGELVNVMDPKFGVVLPIAPASSSSSSSLLSSSPSSSDAVIVRSVLKKDDFYLRTGDLMWCNSDGFYYFVDRICDNFRWKDETVSTAQVAEVVMRFPGVMEAIVYGVPVQGYQGRACMCAIVLPEGAQLHCKAIAEYLSTLLLPHAIPQFIRIVPRPQITDTFKHNKVVLQEEGINLVVIKDPLYWYNRDEQCYLPLDDVKYAEFLNGKAKL